MVFPNVEEIITIIEPFPKKNPVYRLRFSPERVAARFLKHGKKYASGDLNVYPNVWAFMEQHNPSLEERGLRMKGPHEQPRKDLHIHSTLERFCWPDSNEGIKKQFIALSINYDHPVELPAAFEEMAQVFTSYPGEGSWRTNNPDIFGITKDDDTHRCFRVSFYSQHATPRYPVTVSTECISHTPDVVAWMNTACEIGEPMPTNYQGHRIGKTDADQPLYASLPEVLIRRAFDELDWQEIDAFHDSVRELQDLGFGFFNKDNTVISGSDLGYLCSKVTFTPGNMRTPFSILDNASRPTLDYIEIVPPKET